MKYFLLFFLLLPSCCKKEIPLPVDNNPTTKVNQSSDKNLGRGPFEVFLGIHQIEYFADRMVLKSRLSGYDFAKKTVFEKDGDIHYQVILGPFKTSAEAFKAESAIKSRAPDLDISKVRSVR
jgi:phosphotransferase system IIB component